MKKMICDHAEGCHLGNCPHDRPHLAQTHCDSASCSECYSEVVCIPWVDPILKKVQERFNAWVKATKDESGMLAVSASVLKRIIQEESEE